MLVLSAYIEKIKSLNRRDLVIFLIPTAVFLYYLHVFNPGILAYDTINQLHQIATGEFTTWHPFFHTFIEMMCIKVYRSPASVAVFQIFTFSLLWMIICKYNRNDAQNSKIVFVLQIIVTAVISLVPINPIYAIYLQKDFLFSYFIMFLCFLMEVLIDNRGNVDYPFVFILSIIMAFIAQLRHNGMILILVFLVILSVWSYVKKKDFKIAVMLPALTIIFILMIASLNVVYDVETQQDDAVSLMVGHMLADYELNLEINSVDQDKLDNLINQTKLKTDYNVIFKDPTRGMINMDMWRENKIAYINIALKYSIKHPEYFAEHLLKSAPIVWQITSNKDWESANGGVYDILDHRSGFYDYTNEKPVSDIDNATNLNEGAEEYELLRELAYYAKDNHILYVLFDSPGLYMYLSIIVLIVLYWIARVKDLWLIYIPNLLNIGIVFLSIPAQLNRYLYPNLLVFYLLIIIYISWRYWEESDKPETNVISL